MGLKKIPSEGGSGGKRGHSGMEHWLTTEEIKDAARRQRRLTDKQLEHEARRIDPPEFVVAEAVAIAGRGVAALFEGDPPALLPLGTRAVRVVTPDGKRLDTRASVEAARKVPPGEVLGMLFGELSVSDLPRGSIVTIVGD
jgi:glycine/D-amino acid oxidase-like deaminating enzyme